MYAIFSSIEQVLKTFFIKGSRVAFVGEGSHLVAVNTATGKTLFNFDTGTQIYGAPSISNGVVYFSSTNDNLYAYGP